MTFYFGEFRRKLSVMDSRSPLCELAVNTSFQGNVARVRCYSEALLV